MKSSFKPANVFMCVAVAQLLCTWTTALAANIPVIKLKQEHYVFGTMIAYVAKDRLRIDNLSGWKFVLCSHAPAWDIVVYRPDDKTMFTTNYKSFLSRGVVSEMVLTPKPQDETDLTHTKVKYENGIPFFSLSDHRGFTISSIAPSEINHDVSAIVWATYRLPNNQGWPLRYSSVMSGRDFITEMNQQGQTRYYLSTLKMERTQVPAETFAVPPHLKPMKSMQEVILNQAANQDGANGFAELMKR
jgi:hypothetical protein